MGLSFFFLCCELLLQFTFSTVSRISISTLNSDSMISDFFLPVVGGVEGHIYSLSVELIKRGHKVRQSYHSHSCFDTLPSYVLLYLLTHR